MGSITISNDGSYSDLVWEGGCLSIEPATGFAFDTPLSPPAALMRARGV
jgi:hypothetical protein